MSDPKKTALELSLDAEFADPKPPVQAKAPEQPVAEVTPPVEPTKFRREIDLGDGSGKQVFEADSQEGLIDKLAEAQKNATRKIREQNQRIKSGLQPTKKGSGNKFTPKPLTADEEFVIGQSFATNPGAAFDKIFEAKFGAKPEEVIARIDRASQVEEILAGQQAAAQFLNEHKDDFAPTPANQSRIQSYLDSHGYAYTKENFEYAFSELSASGLLESPAPATAAVAAPVTTPEPQKAAISGLPDRSSRTPAKSEVPTVEELNDLPMEEARDRIVRALYNARKSA